MFGFFCKLKPETRRGRYLKSFNKQLRKLFCSFLAHITTLTLTVNIVPTQNVHFFYLENPKEY